MEPWSHGSTIFWDLACHFQNCKLEVCTSNDLKVTGVLPAPPDWKPFGRAYVHIWKKSFLFQKHNSKICVSIAILCFIKVTIILELINPEFSLHTIRAVFCYGGAILYCDLFSGKLFRIVRHVQVCNLNVIIHNWKIAVK